MKKRLISLLLTLCMVVTMVACLGATASAADTFTYTMAKGDTIWGLCQSKGLNYYTCKNAIMSLNKFTNEAQLSNVAVGKVITMPVSDAVASTIASSTAGTISTTTTTVGSTTTTTATGALANGDTIAYYLVAHQMTAGETVLYLYNTWGLNYRTYSDLILSINNIKGYNKMYAGRTYLFPVPTVPAGQTAAYTVISHKVASGETAYNVCNAYNTNYNGALTIVKAVNNGNNLTTIRTNQMVNIPASGYVTVGSAGTGTGSGTGTVVPSTGTSYAIDKTTTKNGSFVTRISATDVTAAASGSTVAIITTPLLGYVVDAITVSKADDSTTTVATNSSIFTMPAYAVKVNVTFKAASSVTSGKAHKIEFATVANGSVSALENGTAVTTAKAGSFITVVPKANAGYKLESISASYNNGLSKVPISVNAFNMPDYDVTVTVKFAAMATYNINAVATTNGSFSFKADGVAATKAWVGQTITIVPAPNANYAVKTVKVTYNSGAAVSMIDAYTFKMPDEAVRVTVTFEGSFGIYTKTLENGSVSYKVDGVAATTAVKNKSITILPVPASGYVVDTVKVYAGSKDADITSTSTATAVTKNSDGLYTYTMPGNNIIFAVTFKAVETYTLPDCKDSHGNYLRYMVNGGYVTAAAEDAIVTIEPVCVDGYKLTGFTDPSDTDELAKLDLKAAQLPITDGKVSFKMPIPKNAMTKTLCLNPAFTAITARSVLVEYDINECTPTLTVDGKAVAGTRSTEPVPWTTPTLYRMTFTNIFEGKTATLGLDFKEGYELDEATAICLATKETLSDANTFTVGAGENTLVKVTCTGKPYNIVCDPDSLEHCKYKMTNDNAQEVTSYATAGTVIFVTPIEVDAGYTVESISANYLEGGVTKSSGVMVGQECKFIMPGGDVTLKFKVVPVKKDITQVTLNAPASSGVALKLISNGKEYASTAITAAAPLNVSAFSKITLKPVLPSSEYKITAVSIVNASDESIISTVDYDEDAKTFIMPYKYDVKITVTVEKTV